VPEMTDSNPMSDFNQGVVEQFRANGGKVGPPFEGANIVLLTTTGAKTGRPRLTPLVYRPDGDRLLIIGSYGGAPKHPAWFLNLRANPTVTVEVGDGTTIDRYEATATVLSDDERNEVWPKITAEMPGFAEYQENTSRVIPVIAITRNG
jgi:deazaflavin-dependent oxidoreductase (nitroreductase family)